MLYLAGKCGFEGCNLRLECIDLLFVAFGLKGEGSDQKGSTGEMKLQGRL